MKVGILQFFGWRDRSVPLNSVYETALERFSILDTTGYDAVWLAEHHFSGFSVCLSVHMMGAMAAALTNRLRSGTEIGMTYLMAAPMSGRSLRFLMDKVLPRIAMECRD